jgi:DNA recombination protein RmuC
MGLGAAGGAVVGWLLAWTLARARAENQARLAAEENAARLADLRAQAARLEEQLSAERRRVEEQARTFVEMEARFREAFASLSADALRANTEEFLKLAGTRFEGLRTAAQGDLEARQKAIDALLEPMRKGLEKVETVIHGVEKERVGAYGTLLEQVKALAQSQGELKSETANLVRALRAPQVRGRWGEIQLRRVVEMAGMLEHCDFQEQVSVAGETGRLRPDLVVRLPGGKNVVVDAKTPLEGYLLALEAKDDATREARLADHARQVGDHMKALSQKGYWEQFQPAPEFVVMFLPGETFFSAALQKDPGLIEMGVAQRVIPASPTTLIALLRSVAYGWQQERIAENAQKIVDAGRVLCDRLRVFTEHYQKVGKGLEAAVGAYDDATRSMQRKLLPAVRKVEELGAGAAEPVPDVQPLDRRVPLLEDGDLVK